MDTNKQDQLDELRAAWPHLSDADKLRILALVEQHATPAQPRRRVVPEDFMGPKPSRRMVEALHDTLADLIKQYLPPEWNEALGVYAITYAWQPDHIENVVELESWIGTLARLQYFLAGVRMDEKGERYVEWVGPAPMLGKAGDDDTQ